MGQTRREFIKSTTASAAMLGVAAQSPTGRHATDALVSPIVSPYSAAVAAEPNIAELAMLALDSAKSAGASYADVRFVRNRTQNVSTREQRVSGVSDNETYGFGVRTLVNGAWGFAASRDLTRDEVSRVARQAVAQARANRSALSRPVELAPAPTITNGTWRSPIEIDPFGVAIEDK
ncbi:MAG TPA: DNA gyrase modulator, partial [Gemmatimonadaceae bacterium]